MSLKNLRYVPLLIPVAVIFVVGEIVIFLAWIADCIMDWLCPSKEE